MKMLFKMAGFLLPVLLSGCGSLPEVYHPQTVGLLNDGPQNDGLVIQLTASETSIPIGTPVVFNVTVRNISNRSLWIPRKPQQGFFWTYPNGRHDCFVFDREKARYFQKDECLQLLPGHEVCLPGLVETYYFDRPGITEFKAEIDVAQNTNPDLQPFWSGRALSNSYGVHILAQQGTSGRVLASKRLAAANTLSLPAAF